MEGYTKIQKIACTLAAVAGMVGALGLGEIVHDVGFKAYMTSKYPEKYPIMQFKLDVLENCRVFEPNLDYVKEVPGYIQNGVTAEDYCHKRLNE